MKAVIIEDEVVAVKNLIAILKELEPNLEIIAVLDSIQSSVNYFQNNELPDLVFMDIQLADGESFEIFKSIEITCPVIFTTAYDSYALEAFKVNSIDYLLKPIEPENVQRALNKLKNFSNNDLEEYAKRMNHFIADKAEYTKTLLIKYRDKLIPLPTAQIAYFYTENEMVTVHSLDGQEWPVESSLDTLMSKLDPSEFFRANRQFIISHSAVKEVVVWFGNRLSVNLNVPTKERIIISKARVSVFKKWLVNN
ncbi:LytR/AlgR family response regulator transcription factor [Plebeiibacterium sediminum]|uniref:LytTR family DNA-binding domain-containing protein n=1 Tax=Plebeiibacterium sediminum TaxID=2992112 RepID=A0AAE3SDS6_9BACT|nr:LytTR family DNA-binding domain-containing protein [Plebeiobacterium sediminum]MCW3785192.1 LytTR family DNA-binding domain-containing protein [Plebeiobacterium sediminum]